MKRLTEKNESPCTCCGGIGSCRTDCSYKQIYDRLAEYEDTGLTPKEIEDMVSVREITPEAEYAINKHANNLIQKLEQLIAQADEKNELQRYKEAEEQGLLEWLPCKVGDTIYRIIDDCTLPGDCGTKRMCKGCEYRNLFIEEDAFHLCELTDSGKLRSGYYRTREEAEKALEGMKNEA